MQGRFCRCHTGLGHRRGCKERTGREQQGEERESEQALDHPTDFSPFF